MKTKRRFFLVLLLFVGTILIGYSSAAVSLSRCDADVDRWLGESFPDGDFATTYHAERSAMFLPFVARSHFEKKWHVKSQSTHGPWFYERGTRYDFTVFGLVFPIWTDSKSTNVVA